MVKPVADATTWHRTLQMGDGWRQAASVLNGRRTPPSVARSLVLSVAEGHDRDAEATGYEPERDGGGGADGQAED